MARTCGLWDTGRASLRHVRLDTQCPRRIPGARRGQSHAMKLIIQIPCFNEEETLPVTLADLPREVAGLRHRRVARHRRRLDRPHDRGRARARRRPHRPADQQQGPGGRLPGRPRRVPEARRRRDRQHRRRQPVLRPATSRSSSRRSSPATPTWSSATARSMTIEHFSPLKKSLQRLGSWVVRQASDDRGARHDVGLPRLQPRGRAPDVQVVSKFTYTLETIIQAGKMLVAIDHVPIRTNPQDARVAAVPVDVVLRAPQPRLDLPHLLAVRAAAGVHERGAIVGARRAASSGRASSSPTSRATAPATSSR